MAADKLMHPLDRFVDCLAGTPVILKPQGETSRAQLQPVIEQCDGKLTGSSFGKSLHVRVPLRKVEELSASPLADSLIYDGDSQGWGVHVTAPTAKLDAYLTRLLSFLVKTPMMVTTADGLQSADREAVERLGGRVRYELKIVNAFTVDLPLERVGDLVGYPRVLALRYDTPLVPA